MKRVRLADRKIYVVLEEGEGYIVAIEEETLDNMLDHIKKDAQKDDTMGFKKHLKVIDEYEKLKKAKKLPQPKDLPIKSAKH